MIKHKNPCEGLKVKKNNTDLSDMFIKTLATAVDKDEENTRKLFNLNKNGK